MKTAQCIVTTLSNLFLIVSNFYAQDAGIKKTLGGVVYFQAGYAFQDFEEITDKLSRAAMPEMNNVSLRLGGVTG